MNKNFFLPLLILIFIPAIASYYNCNREFQLGEKCLKEDKLLSAISHYETAIGWYAPWDKRIKQAINRLWEIGSRAETRGEMALALSAYRAIRGSLYGIRSLYQPYPEWIKKSEEKIAYIGFRETRISLKGKNEENQAPHPFYSFLAGIAFLGWIGVIICFILNQDGHSNKTWSTAGMAIFLFLLWVTGLIMA